MKARSVPCRAVLAAAVLVALAAAAHTRLPGDDGADLASDLASLGEGAEDAQADSPPAENLDEAAAGAASAAEASGDVVETRSGGGADAGDPAEVDDAPAEVAEASAVDAAAAAVPAVATQPQQDGAKLLAPQVAAPAESVTAPPMPASLRGVTANLLAKTDDQVGARKAEEAAVLIQHQLANMDHQEAALREQLAKAIQWGSGMQATLTSQQKADSLERRRLQTALKEKAQQGAKLIKAVQRHERSTETRLRNVTRGLALRTQALAQTQQRLAETNRTLEAAKRSFLASVSQLKKDQAAESLEVSKRESEIQELRAAKVAHESELSRIKAAQKQSMVAAAKQLGEVQDQQQQLRQQLTRERQLAQRLQGSLKNATRTSAAEGRSLVGVHRELRRLNDTFKAAAQDWHATEVQMRIDQAAAAQQVSNQENKLRLLRAAKSSEDAELRNTKARRDKDLKAAQDVIQEEKKREAQLQSDLDKERITKSANDKMFKEEVTNQVRHAQQNKAGMEKLRFQMGDLQKSSRRELEKLTGELQAMKRHESELLGQTAQLQRQLAGNASVISNLSAQVAQANRQVDKDEGLRREAEDVARRAQADALAAKAVAKQLSGTVPQLLEQERLAREQEEAEKAMRAQAQAKAKQQIAHLEQQYTTLVQGQIDQLLPKGAGAAAAGVDGASPDGSASSDGSGSSSSVTKTDAPTAVQETPDAGSASTADVSGDSHSLREMLSQDSAADDGDAA